MLLPILNDDLRIIGTVEFVDNLTLSTAPDYVNQNGQVGLIRLDSKYGRHEGELCLMYYDKQNPETSYAEIITEKEAYKKCLNRGKLELASQLNLQFIDDVEILEE